MWARGRLGDVEASEATAFTLTPRASLAPAALSAGASGPKAPAAESVAAGAIEDKKGVATPLATILERAGRYVKEYEETFRNLVAEETYRQWQPNERTEGRVARTLRSDLVFVRLTGPLPWGTFRDVYEVDGQKVRDRERRLEKLFFAPKASDVEQAEAILNESSRYNVGRAYRNINVPALGLLFLRPENQKRLAFNRKGTRTIAGFATVEVAFEEKASPTLVHDRWMNDVPASGRFWIDETRGTVLRTEIDYDLETEKLKRSPGLLGAGPRLDRVPPRCRPRVLRARHDDRALQLPGDGAGRHRGAVLELPEVRGLGRHVRGAADGLRRRGGRPGPDGAGSVRASACTDARARAGGSPPFDPAKDGGARDGQRAGAAGFGWQPAAEGWRVRRALRAGLPERRGRRALRAEDLARVQRPPKAAGERLQPGERVRSEVVFTMLPGAVPWNLLRDVLEVDGRVQHEAGRLELPPFAVGGPPRGGRDRARERAPDPRADEAHAQRADDGPRLPPPGQPGWFRFQRKGRARVGGQETVEIAFDEVGRPTLNQDGAGGDVPIRGRFWVRVSDGAVVRTRTELGFDMAGVPQGSMGATVGAPQGSMAVTTEYGEAPGLGLLVPLEMIETLEWRTEQARRVTIFGPRVRPALHAFSGGAQRSSSSFTAASRAGRATPPFGGPARGGSHDNAGWARRSSDVARAGAGGYGAGCNTRGRMRWQQRVAVLALLPGGEGNVRVVQRPGGRSVAAAVDRAGRGRHQRSRARPSPSSPSRTGRSSPATWTGSPPATARRRSPGPSRPTARSSSP